MGNNLYIVIAIIIIIVLYKLYNLAIKAFKERKSIKFEQKKQQAQNVKPENILGNITDEQLDLVIDDIFWDFVDYERKRIETDRRIKEEQSILFFNEPEAPYTPDWYSKFVKDIYEFLNLTEEEQLHIIKTYLLDLCEDKVNVWYHHNTPFQLRFVAESNEYLLKLINKLKGYWKPSLMQSRIISLQKSKMHGDSTALKILGALYDAPWIEDFDNVEISNVGIDLCRNDENKKYKTFSITSHNQIATDMPECENSEDKYSLISWYAISDAREEDCCLSFDEMFDLIVQRKDE